MYVLCIAGRIYSIREKPRNPYKERQARNLARVRCAPVQIHYYEGCRKRGGLVPESIKIYRKEDKSYSAMDVFMRFIAIETPSSSISVVESLISNNLGHLETELFE